MKVATILIRKNLPDARVLAESYTTHHPGEKISVLFLDDPDGTQDHNRAQYDQIQLSDLDLRPRDFHRLAAIYDAEELTAAVKPWVLRYLLDAGAETTMYLDPNYEILAPLDDVAELTKQYGIVLAPNKPGSTAGGLSESTGEGFVRHAVSNHTFISVSAGAIPFLEWWSERPWHEGEILIKDGALHRWIDTPPDDYDHLIFGDSNFEAPLRNHPAVSRLLARNREEPGEQEGRRWSEQPYGLEFAANGFRLTNQVRSACRYFLSLANSDPVAGNQEMSEMPDPFDPAEADMFIEWLNGPDPRHPATISRYLIYLYENDSDLRPAFPNLWNTGNARCYLEWAARGGNPRTRIPPELIPADLPPENNIQSPALPGSKPGFNIAGYMNTELGLGEAARLMVTVMRTGGIPFSVMPPFEVENFHEHAHFPASGIGAPEYDTSLICLNANELPEYIEHVGSEFLENRYTIGYWAWEVEVFPEVMAQNADYLDEIWVYGPHPQKIVAPMVDKPVYCCPLPIIVPDPPALSKADFDLPDKFMFYFSFDFNSSIERKNPIAVIEAFKQAFTPDEGPILVIKSMRGHNAPLKLEQLNEAADGRSDIIIKDIFFPRDKQNALMNACDAYVSLHRAEGFGLTMAEAMALGKPVIATGYSGNLVYMNDENSFLVPHGFTLVPPNCDQYPEGARWAEPDIKVAADLMRRVFDDPGLAQAKGERGRQDILRKHSPEARVKFVLGRLADIGQKMKKSETTSKKSVAIRRAASSLSSGPDIYGPTKYRRLVPAIRKATQRLLRFYDVHQHQTGSALLEAIRDLDARVSLLTARRNLDEQYFDDLQRGFNKFGASFYEKTSLSLSTVDSFGRKAIGYRDLAEGKEENLYAGFEDIFRGSEDVIRDRQGFYLDMLEDHGPVVDLGCGRGEMLDLLTHAGIAATGVDIDSGMFNRCRAKGHTVKNQDVLEYLEGQADGSIGAIFSAQLIEHLPYENLLKFLELADRKLKPGGLLISETVNPHSILAMKAFWIDLSHQKPIFPETAVVLHRLFGFYEAIVYFPNGFGDLERDRKEQGDYSVIAMKSPASN